MSKLLILKPLIKKKQYEITAHWKEILSKQPNFKNIWKKKLKKHQPLNVP